MAVIVKSLCVPYIESLYNEFFRIAYMYNAENPKQAVFVETQFELDDALKFYGIASQAYIGDQTKVKPEYWDVRRLFLWNAWEAEKGKTKALAQREFLDLAYVDLKKRGIPPVPDTKGEEKIKEY